MTSLAHDLLLVDVPQVDHGAGARDRDRFRHRSDSELRVDVRGEALSEFDTFTDNGTEPRERERHRVHASLESRDQVLALVVGRDRADLLDKGRASCFHCHARQDGARRVSDRAGNLLRGSQNWGWRAGRRIVWPTPTPS